MSTFEEKRAALTAARSAHSKVAAAIKADDQERKRLERELVTARRTNDQHAVAHLEKQHGALAGKLAGDRERLRGLSAAVAKLVGTFAADPAKQIAEWNDRIPILLFPLRLETRFLGDRLWIRIYPDDCQIDGFEPMLRESEIASVTAYWIETWRAGGVAAQARGAWTALVGALGSGRAAYAIEQYRPENPGELPTKVAPTDVVLVIVPAIAVTAAEQQHAFTYWTEVWTDDGNPGEVAAARARLVAQVGAVRADELIEGFAPQAAGWDPPAPATRADVAVQCAVLRLPPVPPTTSSWNQPEIAALPDRFVALLYKNGVEVKRVLGSPTRDGLAVAPDPSLPADQQIKLADGDLELDDRLRWIAELDAAREAGMAIEIPLSAAEMTEGFDRLFVIGLRTSADAETGARELEDLIEHQLSSKAGYGLVPQGSPTNNTESGTTAHTWTEDPDVSFDRVIAGGETYASTSNVLERRDGQWLAEALGIRDEVVAKLPHAAGLDQSEARAMNVALWNATLGYGLEEMLVPIVSRDDIAATRRFFTRFVSGRGPLPAVRVGKQPYGILPAMAFSRYRATRDGFTQRLHGVLAKMDAAWRTMARDVAHVGKPGNAHQTLLDIVGLHPTSVEFHQRYAESLDQLFNTLVLQHGPLWGGLVASWTAQQRELTLAHLGADPTAEPPILEKFFFGASPLLSGPVVDDVPLSETKPVRAYSADGKNYLAWLATSQLEQIRRQDFGGQPEPIALLYLMLRHSMLLGQWDAGLRFLENRAMIDPRIARIEPAFLHVQGASVPNAGQSKLQHLVVPQPAITGDAQTTLAEHVMKPSILFGAAETAELAEMVTALQRLATAPTSRLERVFAEHIDCASYRLDAWKTGLATARLSEMRGNFDQKIGGLYLGAFGWLEDVRPKPTGTRPVRLDGTLAKTFQRPDDAPLVRDPDNAGFIHAPSHDHAAAAAILKNAYRVNASPANPDAMAVNLSSERVRGALTLLEGVRNGQTLGALLGYHLERGLHDEHSLAEVDKFIYPLRQAFPLVANQLQSTRTDGTVDITLIEARNVVDGQKLVEHVTRTGQRNYPFGLPQGTLPGELPPANAGERAAIDREVDRLLALADAVADLNLAESVYQVVRGNFDRAAAVTKSLQEGGPPPEPEIVTTPQRGLALQHRVALHFDPAAAPGGTPRAIADSPLASWIASRLPPPADVGVKVRISSPALAETTVTVTMAQLGLEPIDLLFLGDLELEQAMTELDDRIARVVRYGAAEHPALAIDIRYTEPAGTVSLFELAALVRSLREVVLKSRALGPADPMLALEATDDHEVATLDTTNLRLRVEAARDALDARRTELDALIADASPLDAYVKKVANALQLTALHGMPQTGTGQLWADLRAIYLAVTAKVQAIVDAWQKRSDDYVIAITGYGALTTDPERFALLARCELLVRANLTQTPPADPALHKADLDAAKIDLDDDRATLEGLLVWAGTSLESFVTDVEATIPMIAEHDVVPFDIAAQKAAVVDLRASTVARVTALRDELVRRVDEATDLLADLPEAPLEMVTVLQQAGKLVLGEEMILLPRFTLAARQAAELASCLGGSAALLTDLIASGRRFPIDDWLYGAARVRAKLAAWENVVVLGEAFEVTGKSAFTALQLPFVANDRWRALEFDTANASPDDRLLYTALLPPAFAPGNAMCGVVLDEWPEIVPAKDVMSAISFQFDRPSSAPPQTMLLAVPPIIRGRWSWDDLVATLAETLDAAKARAVEPAQVDASPYAQLLPSTLMAVTLHWITIATNLAMNNRIYDLIGGA